MPETMAPDLFSDVFQWHGKYLPPRRVGERLLLLGENECLVHGSVGVLALDEPLRRGVSLAEHCLSAGAGAPLAEMLHALGALLRQDLVRPVARPGAEVYLRPDFSAPPVHLEVAPRLDLVRLTAAVDDDTALRWAQALLDGGAARLAQAGLTLVFCDDYLDPRLAAIEARQRAAGRPWLLVRPSGEQAMAGPLFTPAEPASACWHCLAHRWRRNHPARAWWQVQQVQQAQQPQPDSAPPVRADSGLVAERLPRLLDAVRRMLAQAPAAQAVWTLSPPERHPVAARPQCPHCGTPDLMAGRQRERIAPVPGQWAARVDGGWRTMPASATVERLSHHVSPLTGVVARVTPLNAESDEGLTVYRSEIFRTPAPGGDPVSGAWTQLCLGKGVAATQARASAMCEAVERYAAFHQGDEAVVIAPAAELDAPCIAPTALAQFSERQIARFATDRPPHAVAAAAAQEPTWWAPAWSLTADARRYLPLGFCLAHAPAESQCHVSWTSNGCAAGNTTEEAVLQGFLELVERDAAAIWWYGRIRRPAMALDALPAETRQRLARSCGLQWNYWLLDITHDFGIPVAVAVGRHRASGEWAIGFGCSLDRLVACERALTEMSQLIAAGKCLVVPEAPDAPAFLLPLDGTDALPSAAPASVACAPQPIDETIAHCVGLAKGLGMEVIVFQHSRPDIPLQTVKVVVPGLCHIWPELGNRRLAEVPVALGWRSAPLQENQFNPQALYV